MSCLPDAQLQRIAQRAADLRLQPDEWLIREGEQPFFYLVIDGSLDVLKEIAGKPQIVKSYKAGDFFGEVPLLLGTVAFASLRAREASRVMKLDRMQFKELIDGSSDCSALIMKTLSDRLTMITGAMRDIPAARVLVV